MTDSRNAEGDTNAANTTNVSTTTPVRKKLQSHPSSMTANKTALKITYENLTWTVDVPNTDPATKKANPTIKKTVLDNISGTFRPGKLTAIMGSSGAGKTTLLNVIAGYAYGGTTSGSIRVNGEQIGTSFMRELSAFVHQQDIILESMTVREAVTMAAHLRLPRTMTTIEKSHRVEEVLRWLNLIKVSDNMIGSPEKKGISGGERRRVSVAMEMVRNPGILYLDEPTSGLDTFTAYAVAHLLQTVAHHHSRTIVATIHQPSSEIFALFDDLVLLNLGKVIYHGPANEAMKYFDFNLGYKIPMYTNPSDFIFMHIVNGGAKKDQIGVIGRNARSPSPPAARAQITDGHQHSDSPRGHTPTEEGGLAKALRTDEVKVQETEPGTYGNGHASTNGDHTTADETESLTTAQSLTPEEHRLAEQKREQRITEMWNQKNPKTESWTSHRIALEDDIASQSMNTTLPSQTDLANNAATFLTQFIYLCRRAFNDVRRNPYKLRARLGQSLFTGIFVGLCYLQFGYSQRSVQNRRGVLFFLCAGGTMNATMGSLTIFLPEKEVFRREYASKMYSLPAYWFSKFLMELPLRIIFPCLIALIVYWMAGLQNEPGHFFIFAFTLVLIDLVGASLGMMFASIFPSLQVGLAATPMMLLPLMLFGGFFLNADSIPPYFKWLSYISPMKWAFMALARNEFPGLEFDCDDPSQPCTYRTGEDVISALNFDNQPSLAADEGILLGLASGCFIIAYLVLWRTSKKL